MIDPTNQSKSDPAEDGAGKDTPHGSYSSHNHDKETDDDEQGGQLWYTRIVCNLEINLIVHLHNNYSG